MADLEQMAKEYLAAVKEKNLHRKLAESWREDGVYVVRSSKRLVSFSCNDYLGLSQDETVKQAAQDAIRKYGAGAGAARLLTGNHPLYKDLENRLAKLKGTEDAVVFGSGYLANVGTIPALVGRGDLILADKLSHACLLDGAVLSGAKLMRFPHNSVEKCEGLLKKHRKSFKNCLIITDGVFSMDGDVAPIDELYDLAEKHDAWLMTDDAHGLGVLNGGVGSSGKKKPHIQMGTLSKAVGCYGGYVCASRTVVDYLRNAARSFVYSTALPPMVIAAALAALDIIKNDKELVRKPIENARYFTSLLGMDEAASPIVALILGDEIKALDFAKTLEKKGFLVSAIRPPTVPFGTARLRFAFSALHKRRDIAKLAEIIKDLL